MNLDEFKASTSAEVPPPGLPAPLAALWWDAKGDWAHAHSLVDALDTPDGMAVHAYLHRKEGADWNADYWYKRAGRNRDGVSSCLDSRILRHVRRLNLAALLFQSRLPMRLRVAPHTASSDSAGDGSSSCLEFRILWRSQR